MEINDELDVDLSALGGAADHWLAQAEQLLAWLETMRIGADSPELGPKVSEAFALLVRVWSQAGTALASDLADHAASLRATAYAYDEADSQAERTHHAVANRTPALPPARERP